MKKPYYNIIKNLFPNIHFTLLIIFIILANCDDLNRIIKFKIDGNILIFDKENNNTTKTHLFSPLVYVKLNEQNINFLDKNILISENGDFTYIIPGQDISLIKISFEEFTLNSHLILKEYPNFLFNTNKTLSLFSININDGYLTKYEKYKSSFLEKNNFEFIKKICPNNKDDVLFLRIDYFIQMKYTYLYKNNNDIIWYSHFIKIIPVYPNIILPNNDIYESFNNEDYEEDDFYIFKINNNKTINVMYSQDKNNLTLICPPYSVVDKLCGKSRPGHFDGVCSVVAKLFNLSKATRAYFGQKDYQQLFIIQKMVKDLNFDIEIVPCPIVREGDNLALSSRNRYLKDSERKIALNISKSLFEAKKLFESGTATKRAIIDNSLKLMEELDVEYIEFVDVNTFEFQDEIDENTLMLIAARTPETNTRLIDNIKL